MVASTSRFCNGLSSGSHQNGYVYGTSPGHQYQERKLQEPRPQALSQSVWSETSWTSLEWLFGQQTAKDQLQAISHQ